MHFQRSMVLLAWVALFSVIQVSRASDLEPKPSDLERRQRVSFDAFHFEQEKKQGRSYGMEGAFRHIHDFNLWGADQSVSGKGSTSGQTLQIRAQFTELLQEFGVQSLLDAPCGDFGWLSTIELPCNQYTGIDILASLIEKHKKSFMNRPQYQFFHGDISQYELPKADLILCRDCLVHFSFADIFRTLKNFKQTGSHYLLTTTFTDCTENTDITTGDWRLLNLERPPFNFPRPIKLLVEECSESIDLYPDKSLGLWDLPTLNITSLLQN